MCIGLVKQLRHSGHKAVTVDLLPKGVDHLGKLPWKFPLVGQSRAVAPRRHNWAHEH